MNWKFWKKDPTTIKLGKPKDLPSTVGKYLVVNLKYDPDWVWKLKATLVAKENQKGVFAFRVFDPTLAMARGIMAVNHISLEQHPDMIYFEGWYDKDTFEIELTDHYRLLKKDTAA